MIPSTSTMTLAPNASHIIDSPEAMRAFGEQLAAEARAGMIIALEGPMGAGKTCLVQGFARGLGYAGEVTSPTYTFVHEYREGARLPIYHLDCYRLEDPTPMDLELLAEYLPSADGVTVIEWPERLASLHKNIPTGRYIFWYQLEVLDENRRRINKKYTTE